VELDLERGEPTSIPLTHGVTCRAEVEVERVSPLELALRSAGELLVGARESRPPAAGPGPR